MKEKKAKAKTAPKANPPAMQDFISEKAAIFGANMRAARKQRGFTSEALAKFLSISTAYVGLIERGERCPSMETFLKICEFFGETPNTMLTPAGAGLPLREKAGKAAGAGTDDGKKSRKSKMILSMLETFDAAELEHVVNMIKSFKNYTQDTK